MRMACSLTGWRDGSHSCDSDQCRRYLGIASKDALECGHQCYGVDGESFPCIEEVCENRTVALAAAADDWCAICYVATLREAPCIGLACTHVFHAECIKERISMGRPRARLSFSFLDCPMCNVRIDATEAPYLRDLTTPHLHLEAKVQKKALQRWG